MDISAIASNVASSEAMNAKDITLLKKTQDLAKDMSQQLLNTLPPAGGGRSASPPGVGGLVDVMA